VVQLADGTSSSVYTAGGSTLVLSSRRVAGGAQREVLLTGCSITMLSILADLRSRSVGGAASAADGASHVAACGGCHGPLHTV